MAPSTNLSVQLMSTRKLVKFLLACSVNDRVSVILSVLRRGCFVSPLGGLYSCLAR